MVQEDTRATVVRTPASVHRERLVLLASRVLRGSIVQGARRLPWIVGQASTMMTWILPLLASNGPIVNPDRWKPARQAPSRIDNVKSARRDRSTPKRMRNHACLGHNLVPLDKSKAPLQARRKTGFARIAKQVCSAQAIPPPQSLVKREVGITTAIAPRNASSVMSEPIVRVERRNRSNARLARGITTRIQLRNARFVAWDLLRRGKRHADRM